MAFLLNNTIPAVVVSGHWNAAILNDLGWVAAHLLGVPEGETINLQQVIAGGPLPKIVNLFDNFGMCCFEGRLEFYIRATSKSEDIYKIIRTIAEKLPHTPIGGVGFNFQYMTTDQVQTIASSLETQEILDPFGSMLMMRRVDDLSLAGPDLLTWSDAVSRPVQLKIERATDYQSATIDVNYHTNINKLELINFLCDVNPIEFWKNKASDMLNSLYGISVESENYY